MTPADRIIVALDVPNSEAWHLVDRIFDQTAVHFFKLSAFNFLHQDQGRQGHDLLRKIYQRGGEVMLDLKIYDTPDSVRRISRSAFMAGALFVTVHPECVAPAKEALEEFPHMVDNLYRVLPILGLTSNVETTFNENAVSISNAAVCPPWRVEQVRRMFPSATLVCPGIRHKYGEDGGHVGTWTPIATVNDGADYLVIGRPITQAKDPVAAVQEILAMMGQ